MNLDLSSFAFGSYLESGTGTPSWGTALGQSKPDYKFTYPGAETILIGMLYCSVPLGSVSLPLGKGGRVYKASEVEECQICSLFRKVYINGYKINYPFILVLIKEDSDSHSGRKSIKYSNKIACSSDGYLFSNEEFIRQARKVLELSEDACWFVYNFEVYNQDELHMSAVIVDKDKSVSYQNSSERKNRWIELIPESEDYIVNKSIPTNTSDFPLQQIFYGAPGTGKSFKIDKDTKGYEVVRTTFHPDSDYSTFVGAYKPTMETTESRVVPVVVNNGISLDQNKGTYTERRITYKFVKQAFLKAYLGAWKKYAEADDNEVKPQFLVIEEINRGNCAQIFGDLFQLLDRGDNGFSEYPIEADTDLQKEIERAFREEKQYKLIKEIDVEGVVENYTSNNDSTLSEDIQHGRVLLLPSNLYIWATMNTSDQSLFPIDSAFKRRWDWKYIPINTQKEQWFIEANNEKYSWTTFLGKINDIINEKTSSEDKQLGFYFCKAKGDIIEPETFVSKVVFYLWNDVFKDYGFDGEYFQDPDGGTLEFRKFFNLDGSINEKKVSAFMKNLKIEAVGEDNNDAANQGGGIMKVSFPDNTIIEGATTVEVFMKTIDKIVKEHGIDDVKDAEIKFSGLNIIQDEGWQTDKYVKSSQKQMDGYVLFLNAENKEKKIALDKLSDKLNLGLIVEFVS